MRKVTVMLTALFAVAALGVSAAGNNPRTERPPKTECVCKPERKGDCKCEDNCTCSEQGRKAYRKEAQKRRDRNDCRSSCNR